MRSIAGDGDQLQVSASGGTEPAWSSDGGEIFYRSVGGREPMMMAATIRTTPSLAVTSRRPLFSVVDMLSTNPHVGYDISPDGKTFVMVRRTPASRIMVVQNLAELMKR